MKTLDWSVQTLGRDCNSIRLCINVNITRVAKETRLLHLVIVSKPGSIMIHSFRSFRISYIKYFPSVLKYYVWTPLTSQI